MDAVRPKEQKNEEGTIEDSSRLRNGLILWLSGPLGLLKSALDGGEKQMMKLGGSEKNFCFWPPDHPPKRDAN